MSTTSSSTLPKILTTAVGVELPLPQGEGIPTSTTQLAQKHNAPE